MLVNQIFRVLNRKLSSVCANLWYFWVFTLKTLSKFTRCTRDPLVVDSWLTHVELAFILNIPLP